MGKVELSQNNFKKLMKSANSTTYASFVAAQEIVRLKRPFTDAECKKESFIKISDYLFTDFKNRSEIVQKIRDASRFFLRRLAKTESLKWPKTLPNSK